MCNFASFAVGKIIKGSEPLKIYVGNYNSHEGIENGHGLTPGSYRESEWTEDNPESLVVRVESGEDEEVYRAAILAVYPRRSTLLADNRKGITGHPKSEMHFDKAGQLDSEWVNFYESEAVRYKRLYKAGQLDGEWIEYYKSGAVCDKGLYKAGQLDGEWIEYYESGAVCDKGLYKAGVRIS